MSSKTRELTILIIEDGDEYLQTLEQLMSAPRFLQAHDYGEALDLLEHESIDHIFLDMRFDRIDTQRLLGDNKQTHELFAEGSKELLAFLQNNQGLFILEALADSAHAHIPVLLFYDFSGQKQRFARLKQRHPGLQWIGESGNIDDILRKIGRL